MLGYWLVAYPVDPSTGQPKKVLYTSANTPAATLLVTGELFLPFLENVPDTTISVFDGEFSGEGEVSLTGIVLSNDLLIVPDLLGLVWDGAKIEVYEGPVANAGAGLSSLTRIFTGSVKGGPEYGGEGWSLETTDFGYYLEKDLLTKEYIGTGGAEGTPEMKGTLKPFAMGTPTAVPLVLVDPAYLIFQYDGYGLCYGADKLSENGILFGPAKAVVSTFAELRNLTLGLGEWADAPDIGMLRLGGEPAQNGVLVVDLRAKFSYATNAEVLSYLATLCKVTVDVDSINFVTADIGNRTCDLFFDSQVQVKDVVTQLCAGAGGYYLFDTQGRLSMGLVRFKSDVDLTISSGGTTLPLVEEVNVMATSSPYKKVRIGFEKANRVHGVNEISDALKEALKNIDDRLDYIAADGGIGPSEKPILLAQYDALNRQLSSVQFKDNELGNPPEYAAARTAAVNKFTDLTSYLEALSPSSSWDDPAAYTEVSDPQTFRLRFSEAASAISTYAASITGRAGASAFNLIPAPPTVLTSPNSVKATANTGWGVDGVYSNETFLGGCICSFTLPPSNGENTNIGLTQGHPDSRGFGFGSITFGLHRNPVGDTGVYINGQAQAGGPNVPGEMRGAVHFDGRYVRWYVNGLVIHVHDWMEGVYSPYAQENALRFQAAMATNNPSIINISIASAGILGKQGIPGTNGNPGPPGANGQTTYVHFAYADSDGGSVNFTTGDANGRYYVGTYTDFTLADSQDYRVYTWSKFRGEDGNGIPGAPGANGETTYVHTAYANSPDGYNNFSVSDPVGRTYLGVYTDFTLADSGNPAVYTWSLIQGAQGATGGPGAPGANGTDGFSVDSETLNFQVPVYSTGADKPSWTGASGTIRLWKGTDRVYDGVSYSIPTSTNVSGLSLSGNTFSFSSITDDTGSFVIRASRSGVNYDRIVNIKRTYDGEAAFKGTANFSGFGSSGTQTVPASRTCIVSASASYSVTGSSIGSWQGRVSLYWRNKTDGGPTNFLGSADGTIAFRRNDGTAQEPQIVSQPGSVSAAFQFTSPNPSKEIEYSAVVERIAGGANATIFGTIGLEVRS